MSSPLPVSCDILRVHPHGHKYSSGTVLELHPSSDALIKDEPGTIIWRETLPDGADVATKFYRRGLGSWIRGRLTTFRAHHEFDGLRQLESLGIPCSPPLFWCHGRYGAHGWGEMLVTLWVPDSRPLSDVLASDQSIGTTLDLTQLFADVARMHDAGLRHGTLLARNIMLQGAATALRFVFIDMPRFHRFPRAIRNTRMALYDLLYLCDSLAHHFPAGAVPQWLTAYGMPVDKQAAFLVALKQFRNTSRLRRIIGAEFNIRHLLAKVF